MSPAKGSTLSPEQYKLLKNIAEDTNCKNNNAEINGENKVDFSVAPGSVKGDGYLGVIHMVTVRFPLEPYRSPLDLIVKCAQNGRELRKQTPVSIMYQRETLIYEKVFSEFDALSKEYKTDGFQEYVRYYGSCHEEFSECLVLQNMKSLGYRLWNRQLPMDFQHASLVFATYGRYHGMSMVLRAKKPQVFNELAPLLFNVFRRQKADVGYEPTIAKMMENCRLSVSEALGNRSEGLVKSVLNGLDDCLTEIGECNPEASTSVIIHGDCWCNNMMFKYEDNDKLKTMCLLDWQLARIGHQTVDLVYFFYSCCGRDVMNRLTDLLIIYHESLCKCLKSFQCDPRHCCKPVDELVVDFKKYSKFGLFIATLVLKVMVSEPEEALSFSDMADEGHDLMEAFGKYTPGNLHAYHKRVADIVHFLKDNHYI